MCCNYVKKEKYVKYSILYINDKLLSAILYQQDLLHSLVGKMTTKNYANGLIKVIVSCSQITETLYFNFHLTVYK